MVAPADEALVIDERLTALIPMVLVIVRKLESGNGLFSNTIFFLLEFCSPPGKKSFLFEELATPEVERGTRCADGRSDVVTPKAARRPLPWEARSLVFPVPWRDVSINFVAQSA